MRASQLDIDESQERFCAQHGAAFVSAKGEVTSGVALSTKGRVPMNGLRHPLEGDTTGWYIWFGEEFSNRPAFFQPVHTRHLYDEYPDVMKLLGLPPGYRFLVDGDYLDVWYDPSLLKI